MSYRRRVSQTTAFYRNIRISKAELECRKTRERKCENNNKKQQNHLPVAVRVLCALWCVRGLPSVWIWSLNSSINNLIVHLMNLLLFSFTSKCARSRRFKKTHHAAPLSVDDGFEQIDPNNEWLKWWNENNEPYEPYQTDRKCIESRLSNHKVTVDLFN